MTLSKRPKSNIAFRPCRKRVQFSFTRSVCSAKLARHSGVARATCASNRLNFPREWFRRAFKRKNWLRVLRQSRQKSPRSAPKWPFFAFAQFSFAEGAKPIRKELSKRFASRKNPHATPRKEAVFVGRLAKGVWFWYHYKCQNVFFRQRCPFTRSVCSANSFAEGIGKANRLCRKVLKNILKLCFGKAININMESLILAQDERWRYALTHAS